MENGAADIGSTMTNDVQEELHLGSPNEDNHMWDRQRPIMSEIASFTSVTFLFTIALVSRVLHKFHKMQRTVDDIQNTLIDLMGK